MADNAGETWRFEAAALIYGDVYDAQKARASAAEPLRGCGDERLRACYLPFGPGGQGGQLFKMRNF